MHTRSLLCAFIHEALTGLRPPQNHICLFPFTYTHISHPRMALHSHTHTHTRTHAEYTHTHAHTHTHTRTCIHVGAIFRYARTTTPEARTSLLDADVLHTTAPVAAEALMVMTTEAVQLFGAPSFEFYHEVCVCVGLYLCACVYVPVGTCNSTCRYLCRTCVCVCLSVCLDLSKCRHSHTYTHTHTLTSPAVAVPVTRESSCRAHTPFRAPLVVNSCVLVYAL